MARKTKLSYQLIAGCGARVGEWFYSYVLKSSLSRTRINGDSIDSQFPLLSIINYPFTHTTQEGFKEQDRTALLGEVVEAVEMTGAKEAECVFLCNTFYCLKAQLQGIVDKRLKGKRILWLESVLGRNLKDSQRGAKTLILCSSKSSHERLYSQTFTNCVYPSAKEQKRLDKVIKRVCLYQDDIKDVAFVAKVIKDFLEKSEQTAQVLIGCSELSIIAHQVSQSIQGTKKTKLYPTQDLGSIGSISNSFICPLRMLSDEILSQSIKDSKK